MASRQAIEGAIRAADGRLDRMRPLMETYERDMLLDDGGKWTVRDCLSHVAATARISGAGQRALARVQGQAPPPPAPGAPTMDERNQQAITERAGKSIADLVQETKDAHAAAWDEIRKMTDAELDTKVPDTQAGRPAASVGGIMLRFLEYHEGGQMDRIEAALRLRTRWV